MIFKLGLKDQLKFAWQRIKAGGGGGGGWTFQAEPEQHVQKTESKKAMKYLWKGDMFHVTEVPLIKVSG